MLAFTFHEARDSDALEPEGAVLLLTDGVVGPEGQWLSAALGTVILCRACGERLQVAPVRGQGRAGGAVAVDTAGRLVFGSGGVSRDAFGARLCDGCFELAGWENTHRDEGHQEKPDPDCPLCDATETA